MKIRVCTPLRSHMGYAELGRMLVDQLLQAGHEVGTTEIPVQSSDADFGPLAAQAIALRDRLASADVNIVNMIAPLFERYLLPGACNIGYTMFEADRLPDDWVARCNRMDAIWVPSEWVRKMFVASGVTVPVAVVGLAARPTAPAAVPAGPFRLLSVFQWSARKNPAGLLRAFCAAFDGDDGVVLTLKAHRDEDPARNAAFVRNAVGQVMSRMRARRALPRVEIATDFYSAERMQQLQAASHAVVSLAHAEGWALPAWEASLAGRPVVHTGWSSPVEFVHPAGQVRHQMAPVFGMEDFVSFYDIGMRWADPDLDHAVELLRSLREEFGTWRERALAHREMLHARYAPAARVAQLQSALGLALAAVGRSQRTGG